MVRSVQSGQSMELLAVYLARMGLRAGDSDAVAEAMALAGDVPEAAIENRFVAALTRWLAAISAGDAREIAAAADVLESVGWRLLAADALSDATLIADRHRLPEGNDWSARARAIYQEASAVPLLDALRSPVR